MDLTKRYTDCFAGDKKVDVLHMVRNHPEWAANRIQVGERALAMFSPEQKSAVEKGESAPAATTNNRYAMTLSGWLFQRLQRCKGKLWHNRICRIVTDFEKRLNSAKQNVVDITTIPAAKLEGDLQDSRNDISTCEVALSMGIQTYSGGLVKKRLDGNRHFVDVITAELSRRAEA